MRAELTVIGEVTGRWDSRFGSERERRDVPATLEEICTLGNWEFVDFDGKIFPVAVEWLRSQDAYAPLGHARQSEWIDGLMSPSFLKFSCVIEYSDQYVQEFIGIDDESDVLRNVSLSELEAHVAKSVLESFSGVLMDAVLAANIARLGSLLFPRVYRFLNDDFVDVGPEVGRYLNGVLDEAERRGWPSFHDRSVEQVVRWLRRVPGYRERHTDTSLGRALAAASHLLAGPASGRTLDLVWALLGLEALYARGNAALQQQLIDKTEAYLGARTSHKREFSGMYDFRSRFIHGDVNFVFAHDVNLGTREHERFSNALAASEEVAIALLFATLQKMCSESRVELQFRVEVVPPEPLVPDRLN